VLMELMNLVGRVMSVRITNVPKEGVMVIADLWIFNENGNKIGEICLPFDQEKCALAMPFKITVALENTKLDEFYEYMGIDFKKMLRQYGDENPLAV